MLPNLTPMRTTCRTTSFSFRVTIRNVFWAHLRKAEVLQQVAAAWNRLVARTGGKTSNTPHQRLTQQTLVETVEIVALNKYIRSLRSRRDQNAGVLFGSGATARSERLKCERLLEEAKSDGKSRATSTGHVSILFSALMLHSFQGCFCSLQQQRARNSSFPS